MVHLPMFDELFGEPQDNVSRRIQTEFGAGRGHHLLASSTLCRDRIPETVVAEAKFRSDSRKAARRIGPGEGMIFHAWDSY